MKSCSPVFGTAGGKYCRGETCSLSLEVNARQEELTAGAKEPEYAWRLVVFGYDLNDERITPSITGKVLQTAGKRGV